MEVEESHRLVLEWLRLEWAYQQEKFISMGDAEPAREPSRAKKDIDNYYHQAVNVFGLDKARGMQRLMKSLATMTAVCTYAIVDNGLPPAPGRSSTEDVVEWRPAVAE